MIRNSIPFISFLILMTTLVVRIGMLKKKGIQTGSGNGEKSPAKRILLPVFSLVILIWIFEIVRPAFHVEFRVLPGFLCDVLIGNTILNVSGAILILISLVLWFLTLKDFGSSLRFGLQSENQGKLVSTGIFARSRNPFFLSLDLYFVGVAMMIPSVFQIMFALAAVLGIHFFILKEERFLASVHGAKYLGYCKKVRRYF